MSTPPELVAGSPEVSDGTSAYTPTGNTYAVLRSTIAEQPDEKLAPLSKMEFQVLLDGETNQARAGRDLCWGICGSGLFGLIALIATIDWSAAFKGAHWGPFIWVMLQFGATLASGIGATIYQSMYARKQSNSAYSNLIGRLKGHFSISES